MFGRLDINPLMPRHRIEHEPRHRAPRADRRAPPYAALSRPSPSHAKPSGRQGQLGKAFDAAGSGVVERAGAAGTRLGRGQRDLLTGAVRGLMVSPWFAAGAGFVIAAGAFIYAPHAELSFGNGLVTQTPCSVAGCTVPQQAPVIAGGQDGLVTPSPSPSSSGHTSQRAAAAESDSAPDLTYTVQQDGSGMFQMTITMTSDHPIGPWRLGFEIPGASDLSVPDASWQPSGSDGGTASGPSAGSTPNAGQPSAGTSGDGADAGSDSGGGGQSYRVSFVVDGKGDPTVAPDHCSFDGSACDFTQH
jgi:hypothetical protein